jgi:hypothetical protein
MKFHNALLFLPLMVSGVASAQSVSFDFSSLGTALITFQGAGGNFDFSPDTTGFDFQITNASGPVLGLDGLKGNINGTFEIGTITTLLGGLQEAPITGSGTLSINDGMGNNPSDVFTATISASGYNAFTFGNSGGLNPESVINLSNFSYTGTNTALQNLANSSMASETVTFQFLPAETLTQLASGGSLNSTTFSGSLEAIPESSTCALILGCIALGFAIWRREAKAVWCNKRVP